MNSTPSTTHTAPDAAGDRRAVIIAAIIATAPDVADGIDTIADDIDLFEEFGLDSMDRLNIMTAISESTGVAIPEDQYPSLTTMRALTGHLS